LWKEETPTFLVFKKYNYNNKPDGVSPISLFLGFSAVYLKEDWSN
jgi:hypothetical protein